MRLRPSGVEVVLIHIDSAFTPAPSYDVHTRIYIGINDLIGPKEGVGATVNAALDIELCPTHDMAIILCDVRTKTKVDIDGITALYQVSEVVINTVSKLYDYAAGLYKEKRPGHIHFDLPPMSHRQLYDVLRGQGVWPDMLPVPEFDSTGVMITE